MIHDKTSLKYFSHFVEGKSMDKVEQRGGGKQNSMKRSNDLDGCHRELKKRSLVLLYAA
jgi:hypothetical protein